MPSSARTHCSINLSQSEFVLNLTEVAVHTSAIHTAACTATKLNAYLRGRNVLSCWSCSVTAHCYISLARIGVYVAAV
jgi:hypothetical protein